MDRRPLYAAILVLVISLGSSQYLSFTTQKGLGELLVDDISVQSSLGMNMTARVHRLQYDRYGYDQPLIVALHGTSSSISQLYGFCIEFARRNMTVVTIELTNIENMDEEDLNQTGFLCSEVVEYMISEFDVDGDTIGVLAHAEGFHVALRMFNFTGLPDAMIGIGFADEYPIGDFNSTMENVMLAIGEDNQYFSIEEGMELLQNISGISEISIGTRYGSFENGTAYKMITSPSNERNELVDSLFIKEASAWMIHSLQGAAQLDHTLSIDETIYQYQIQADLIYNSSLIGLSIVLIFLFYSILPENLRTRIPTSPRNDGN